MDFDATLLRHLGFTKLAIACYSSLYRSGPTLASALANDIGKGRTHVYPTLRALEEKGFAVSFKTNLGATYFAAMPIETALDDFFAYQKRRVLPIIRQQRLRYPPK